MDALSKFLAARALKEKKFPLKYLLALYYKASPKDVYINNYEGLCLLIDWLGPIDIPLLDPNINRPLGISIQDVSVFCSSQVLSRLPKEYNHLIHYQCLLELANHD